MATPAINTKIEQVIEAVETLSIAAAARAINLDGASFQNVLDAREEMKHVFTELLQPVLRVAS